ncbi:hypothetical protein E2C01_059360 [Portunus trituberculatus]|uniref:Uncharacterized protein n=1 Tax=Portunus trituberculatus TaxID=210409 RepID=A0A5B7H848_PORTR|nr:hypothetical protein [Portunus trituberculatus]
MKPHIRGDSFPSHWLVGVRLEPMSDQAEFSSTWSPSAGQLGGGMWGNW